MTRTLRELEHELLRETGKRLARFGFSTRPKGQTFHHDIDGGRVGIHLSFIEHESDVDVTVDVAIRFDAVEDLVHRSNKLLSKKEKADTFTLGAELGNLERGEPFRITVSTTGEVGRAADGIERKLETVGLPYIEQYSQPGAAYSLLSRDDREVWVHSPIHAERAKRACALLEVMGRHSEITDIGAKKLSFLKSVNDPGAAVFSRFLAELQANGDQ
ncbi:MAG TPA: hypothetical protein VNO30_43815 [Kofleriaceae bacterium]|nr:hypothetical protein [Kofleriaceae bacterium]